MARWLTEHRGNLLQVFVRAPVRGGVKTRLAAGIGADQALLWHRWLVARTLAMASAETGLRVEVWVDGDPRHEFFRDWQGIAGWRFHRQCGGDLGRRMGLAARRGLRRAQRVVLIGGDCPALDHEHLRAAFAGLRGRGDALLTPAEDGGYVLLGLTRFHPRLFHAVDWGSARVAEQTRRRLQALAWQWSETESLWDLDRPEDARRAELASLVPPPPGFESTGQPRINGRTIRRRNRRIWRRSGRTNRRTRARPSS